MMSYAKLTNDWKSEKAFGSCYRSTKAPWTLDNCNDDSSKFIFCLRCYDSADWRGIESPFPTGTVIPIYTLGGVRQYAGGYNTLDPPISNLVQYK